MPMATQKATTHAETPLEKRPREALEKAVANQETKVAAARCKTAESVLAKASPMVLMLTALLAREGCDLVAAILRDPVVASLQQLEVWAGEATSVIEGSGSGGTLPDVQEVAAEVARTRKTMVLVTSMLATLARARA